MSAAEVLDLRSPLERAVDDAVAAQERRESEWESLKQLEAGRHTAAELAAAKESVAALDRAAKDAAGYAAQVRKMTEPDELFGPSQTELDEAYETISNLTYGPAVLSLILADSPESVIHHAEMEQVTEIVVDAIAQAGAAPIHEPESIDDAHMAESFAHRLDGRFLYVAATGRWHRWDGRRWCVDAIEAVHEEARQFVLDLGIQMLNNGADSDIVKRVATYRNRAKLDALVTVTRRIDGIVARQDEFDRDPDLLNCANGIVDLRTGTVTPHNPRFRMTKLAPTNYKPEATHPDVDQLFEVVDDDVRNFLITLLGYAATGHTSEDIVTVWDGTGANGKTTVLEAAGDALGDYAGPAAAQLVMKTGRDEHPTIKADLQGKRLVWISETEENGSLRMEQVKALTGGDKIKARVMRGDYFDFEPTHTLVIATNHRPYVNATEHAAWRRLHLVPFPFTYAKEADAQPGDRVMDRGLRRRLKGTAQREAVLAWIVAGAMFWHQSGFPKSPTIDAATTAWRHSEDAIHRFIDEELTLDPEGQITGRELYVTYTDWCRNEGRPAKSNKNFVTEFLAHETTQNAGILRVNVSNVAHYRGVRKPT